MQVNQTKTFSYKISNMRALAIILVVLLHSIIIYSTSWDLYHTVNKVIILEKLENIISYIAMPLFFFISGYLYYYTHQKCTSLSKFIIKKIKRLIIPYFFVGFLYLIPIRYFVKYSSYLNKTLLDLFINNFCKGIDVGQLWFLPTLFIIFILSEVILKILDKLLTIKKYSEVILLIISFLLYYFGYLIGIHYAPLLSAFSYFLWFALGLCLSKWNTYIENWYKNKLLLIISIVINILLFAFCLNSNKVRVIIVILTKVLMLLNLYVLIPNQKYEILDKIAIDSFGIYLFHSPLVYITYSLIPNANPVVVVFINFIIFAILSLMLTEFIRRNHLGIIIGEYGNSKN